MMFVAGLNVGVALATIVIAFVSMGSYDRGVSAASNAPWRLELRSRREHSRGGTRAPAGRLCRTLGCGRRNVDE
jgi:hypothetical protein